MERNYKTLIFLFAAIVVISLSGFFWSYISHAPDFGRFPWPIHLHFTVFFVWLLLVVIQPVLIKNRNFHLHRRLGKASYFLVPVLVITILLLVRIKVIRIATESIESASIEAMLGLLDAVSLTLYYGIAVYNRRNIRWHVAFIIGASLVVLNPGMARLLNSFAPDLGLLGAVLVPFLIPGVILLYEKFRLKRPMLKSLYLVFIACWTIEIVLLMTIPRTEFWKNLVSAFVADSVT